MGDSDRLVVALAEARTVSRAWARRSSHLLDEYRSACNLAAAEACLKWDSERMSFLSYCRYLMYRRCRDVYRHEFRYRDGRHRARTINYDTPWWEFEGGSYQDAAQPPWWEDTYAPDDSAWLFRQVAPHITTLPAKRLCTELAARRVILYLELGSMKAVAQREGVDVTQICHDFAQVVRGLKALKVPA